jgi:hypothetical protein
MVAFDHQLSLVLILKLAKEILSKFDKCRFYLGKSMNIDGMVVLQFYREDGSTPVFIYFKDGLRM